MIVGATIAAPRTVTLRRRKRRRLITEEIGFILFNYKVLSRLFLGEIGGFTRDTSAPLPLTRVCDGNWTTSEVAAVPGSEYDEAVEMIKRVLLTNMANENLVGETVPTMGGTLATP